MRTENKYSFRGIWYPTSFIKATIDEIRGFEHEWEPDDPDELQEAVDDVMKSDPNNSSKFFIRLNEYKA